MTRFEPDTFRTAHVRSRRSTLLSLEGTSSLNKQTFDTYNIVPETVHSLCLDYHYEPQLMSRWCVVAIYRHKTLLTTTRQGDVVYDSCNSWARIYCKSLFMRPLQRQHT